MPLPAHHLLDPGCAVKPAWAVFDRELYLQRHADARAVCAGKPTDAALIYYLRVGARLGHSPSALFDELFYLERNPDIAELVRAGNYASGFDHFCQHGHRGVSPHWLFDDALYANLYEDMTLENLDQHRCYGRYDHYLKSGQRERRMGHFLFDGMFYRTGAQQAGVNVEGLDRVGPYAHFLSRLGADEEELAPSVYFDPLWYLQQHPGARQQIGRGRYGSAIAHYLTNDTPEHFNPVAQFSEVFYRRRHPDIQAAIEQGYYRCAYQQFVQYGAFELRQPCADIDLAYYRDLHERVRNDLDSGAVRDAFAHLRLIGLPENLSCFPPDAKPALGESATRALFEGRARAQLALFARQRLDFTYATAPQVSVIMVMFNRFELTMLALSSLRDNFTGDIELILVDNASIDDTRRITSYVSGAKIIRNAENIGFLRGCNLALEQASAPALLYLNNDVELAHGALAMALRRLGSDDDIGAVGGKILRSNGTLQEAGSIIWRDGTTTGYMREGDPLAPEANFVRDVDYCSAVFLLCRTSCVRALGGFDEAFAPAYFEDADLCVRTLQAGFRTIYDPAVMVHHLEFGSAPTTEASMALMRRGKRIFRKKHQAFLDTRPPGAGKVRLEARSPRVRPMVLFIEDTVPLRRLGSGFVRSNDIVHAIARAGHEVHVFPLNGAEQDVMSLFSELPEDAEILHDRNFSIFAEFFEERRHLYRVIWVARAHNFARILPLLQKAGIDPARTKIILDSEALASAREAARASLAGAPFELDTALREEFLNTQICAKILAVNIQEATALRNIGLERVSVLGTARAPCPTAEVFGQRSGLLFVGAIHQADSPNMDALRWYQADIQPALAAALGQAPMLHVAGYTAPGIDLSEFANNPGIRLHGALDDTRPLYRAARLFIAPTRFAAGTPYKLIEAAAYGVPCVATDLLVGQLGWSAGVEILSAPQSDAKSFAARIAALYGAEALWREIRKNALRRLAAAHDLTEFDAEVGRLLDI